MKVDIITMNLIDITNNVKCLIKKLSENNDYISLEKYSDKVLTLMDILDSVKIINDNLETTDD